MRRPQQMPANPEEILDDAVDGREALEMGGRLEAAHLALALPRRLVGDLRAIVGILVRVSAALTNPRSITRFGGLSLGESTHVVDEVCLLDRVRDRLAPSGRAFLVAPKGRLTLPV